MKAIKYLLMSALLMGVSTAAMAQDGTKADVEAVKSLIKSKPADLDKQLKDFYKKNKKNAENLVAFGRAFFEAKDTANAAVYARYALAATKNSCAPAYVLLGDIAAYGDDGGAAALNYEQAIYADPKNPEAYYKYATVYRKIDAEGAVAKLEELRQQRPDYPVDALIGHLNYLSMRYGPAIQAFGRVPLADLQRRDYVEYAFSGYLAKQYTKAIEICEAGLKKEPVNATLNRLAMFCNTETKNYDAALRYADVLFNKVDKDSVNISEMDHLYFAKALIGAERIDDAIAELQKGLKIETEEASAHAELYNTLSDAYKAKKEYTSAIDNYRKYLETAKEADATEWAGLGMLYMQYARNVENEVERADIYKLADKAFAELIEKFPEAEEYGLQQRGYANANADPKMTEGLAKPHFERLIELIQAHEEKTAVDNNRLLDCYRYLMSYYYQQKDNEKALEYAQKQLELKPDDADLLKVVESLTKSINRK